MPDTTLGPEVDTGTPNTDTGFGEVTTLVPEIETTTQKTWEVTYKERLQKLL